MLACWTLGADRVSLADTVGYADPGHGARLFDKARALVGDKL
jgi:hydroxymethylglutaryl-CoA lyase